MAGNEDNSKIVGVRMDGRRLDRFEDFKTSVEADSDSEGLRRAVDLAHEAEIEVGARPRELEKDSERLQAENDQLRERIDEKDEQIDELKDENAHLGDVANRLDREVARLRSTSPLQMFRNIAVGAFVLGTFTFIALVVAFPRADLPYIDIVALGALVGVLGGGALVFVYVVLYAVKVVAPDRYARATEWFFSLPVVARVIDVEKWAPSNDRPTPARYRATGKE